MFHWTYEGSNHAVRSCTHVLLVLLAVMRVVWGGVVQHTSYSITARNGGLQ